MPTKETTNLPGLKPLMVDRKIGATAKLLGLSENHMYHLVHCTRGASLSVALKIARHFGVSVETLTDATEATP